MSQSEPLVDKERFLRGLTISLKVAAAIYIVTLVLWLIVWRDLLTYPFSIINLAMGGVILLISGIIGPGRFKRHFDLVLYAPRDGGTFTKYVKVATFAVNPEITTGELIVNGTVYDTFEYENGVFEKVYPEETFIDGSVNYFWIRSGEYESNKSLVSFYDPDDFTPEEVEEIEKTEFEEETKYTVQEAREKFIKDRTSHTGSFSLGMMTASGIIFLIDFIVSTIVRAVLT